MWRLNIHAFVKKLRKQPNLSLSRINIYLFRLSVICKNLENDLDKCSFKDVQSLIDKMRCGEIKKQDGEPAPTENLPSLSSELNRIRSERQATSAGTGTAPAGKAPPKKARGHNFCPSCGFTTTPNDKFCPDCGKRL